jgi:hypothetical protein
MKYFFFVASVCVELRDEIPHEVGAHLAPPDARADLRNAFANKAMLGEDGARITRAGAAKRWNHERLFGMKMNGEGSGELVPKCFAVVRNLRFETAM